MIWLYSDVLYRAGGIETYLHALATHLQHERIPFRVVVAELEVCPLVDELVLNGANVYRQRRIAGDRWLVRQRIMMAWLRCKIRPGDWIYCVRQPMPQLYLTLVRLVHRARARIAASWMLAPEFTAPVTESFKQAVAETDSVISVSRCTVDQFKTVYGYAGQVSVVPYHNLRLFDDTVPLISGPPLKIGYLGRVEIKQKNLDRLLHAFALLRQTRSDIELHIYGRGPDESTLRQLAIDAQIEGWVFFHGEYDHRFDLPKIMSNCHFFVYPSRFEGGPCFTLLEMLQAGRFCLASAVGGIPDLYANHPEAGLLIPANADADTLVGKLEQVVKLAERGEIDARAIRQRYFDGGFDLKSAHMAWCRALGLPQIAVA